MGGISDWGMRLADLKEFRLPSAECRVLSGEFKKKPLIYTDLH
jgi:hypothetical protein